MLIHAGQVVLFYLSDIAETIDLAAVLSEMAEDARMLAPNMTQDVIFALR